MYREDRNIDFIEIEPFVEPLDPAAKEIPPEGAGKAAEGRRRKGLSR